MWEPGEAAAFQNVEGKSAQLARASENFQRNPECSELAF